MKAPTHYRSFPVALIITFLTSLISFSAPPDLTSGGVPNEDPPLTFNLGPTGMRGWAYHVRQDTGESRQILVTAVDAGSPADGILAVDDVILGASGTATPPSNFSADARKGLAYAIQDAEANSPATLQLLRWRAGSTSTVSITLQTLGSYSATAPYSCPKSTTILNNGLNYVFNNETSGRYSFGALTLLATGNPAYAAKVQTEARALVPSQSVMNQMMSDDRDSSSMITWQRGHTLLFLAEYYLATNDAQVLPAIEAYAVNIAKNRSLFGTMGHIYADKWPDGSANGPMGGVYGVVNSAGMPCFLGVLLAKECGLTNPELDPAIEAANRFYAYYAGKGAIPYGEHEPYIAHESNGKSGLGALYFGLQTGRVSEGQFFAKMATASANEREVGHTGSWFNYLWAPLGAAAGGEEAAAAYFSRISWMLDLNRRWDGKFQYDCLNGEGQNNGSSWYDFRMSTAALLTYALPHRELRITGKNHEAARYLSSSDVTDAVAADDYDADVRSDSELISDLASWSPVVRREAAAELGTRSINGSELNQITTIANDTGAPSGSRAGACFALGEIGNTNSAAVLAALLTDTDRYVRFAAAEGMRYLPTSANLAQLNTILTAADSTANPLFPMADEDPLQFAHGKLAMLLFYSGNAYGPKGIIHSDGINGVDRNLLYPAIRAVAQNPVGQSRGTLSATYDHLDSNDLEALAGTIVDSIVDRSPADKMFSNGIRTSGVRLLERFGIAEGVPACMIYADDEAGGRRNTPLQQLGDFAGSVLTVTPDPNTVSFLQSYLSDGETAATAQASLDAIAADTDPTPLVAFKSIQSATADDVTLSLPTNSTTLRVTATDHAQGDSIFTWTKLHGPGNVTFTPNGTDAAAISTVEMTDSTPGVYQFQVTMSDSRGLTEVYATVAVELLDGGSADTTPPNPNPASFAIVPSANNSDSISMTATAGSDASGLVEYLFTETSGNPGGTSSQWQTSATYTDAGLDPSTSYTYTVTMRDVLGNTGTPSAGLSATTPADQSPGNDTNPPTPNGAKFASAPSADSFSAISMTASIGSDPSGPVEYLFTETSGNPGATSSGWQASPNYTDSGLNEETEYTYTVTMRDAVGNVGNPSAPASATTLASGLFNSLQIAEVFGHNENDNYTGNIGDLINGSGMNGNGSDGVVDWPVDVPHPSTWTATSNAYQAEWQAQALVAGGSNSKIGWAILDLGSPISGLDELFLWHIRENNGRYASTFNVYIATSPSAAISHGPTNGTAIDYDFSTGGWTLINTGAALTGSFQGNQTVDLLGNTARYIGIEILTNNGDGSRVGFAEMAVTAGAPSGPDTNPPLISSVTPSDDATNVAIDSDLVVAFNEVVSTGSGLITIKNLTDNTQSTIDIADGTQVSTVFSELTINPTVDLLNGKNYAIQISNTAIEDAAGNDFAGISDDTTWNFSTVVLDETPPSILSLAPAHEASDVLPGSNLVITFDEDVQANSGNILIREFSGDAVVDTIAIDSGSVAINGAEVTIDPSITFSNHTQYYVEVADGAVHDLAGNSFAGFSGNGTWSFTTGADQIQIGPGADIASANQSDGSGDRLNIGLTSASGDDFVTLPAGTYNVVDFQLNVKNHTAGTGGAGTVAPMLVSGSSGSWTTLWVGGDVDPASNGIQTAASYTPGSESFTLVSETNVYAGFFTKNGGADIPSMNISIGTTDHDGNGFTAPSGSGQSVNGISNPGLQRSYAFEINVVPSTSDTTPPSVLSLIPTNGASGAAPASNLVITFDEDVQANSGNILIREFSGDAIVDTIAIDSGSVTISGAEVTIDPSITLSNHTQYYVEVADGAIQDISGNSFGGISGNTSWSFTTGADQIQIGPGADIASASSFDTPGEDRLNIALSSASGNDYVTLPAGTYNVVDFQLNVNDHTAGIGGAGTVAPILISGSSGSWTTLWVGGDVDPASNGIQTAATYNPGSETFTLASATDVYAGIFTKNEGSAIALVNLSVGKTDHDANGFTAPTGAGQTVDGISNPDLGRSYAFEVNVAPAAAPSNDFSNWIDGYNVGAMNALNHDADGDGNSNGAENYFGTDPSLASAGFKAGVVDKGAGTFTFTHPMNDNPADDLTATYTWSKDLTTFHSDGASDGSTSVSFAVSPPSNGMVTVTATVTGPSDRIFVGLQITQD